jgi:hypothetical protein
MREIHRLSRSPGEHRLKRLGEMASIFSAAGRVFNDGKASISLM